MRKILNWLVLLPLAVVFIVFAVANRHFITVSFDPFNAREPALSLTLPLFAVIIGAAISGVVAGSSATWFGQRRWRRAARRHEADALSARAQLADLQAEAARSRHAALPAPQPSPYGLAVRDKRGATL